MSHFTVLVVGDNPETQLAPFHEFECTGNNDEFVQDIDTTEEHRASYEKDTTHKYQAPDGTLVDPYEHRFYREPTPEEVKEIGPFFGSGHGKGFSYSSRDWGDGKGYRAKVHFIPEGFKEVEVPYKQVMTFLEYVKYETSEKTTIPFGGKPDLQKEHKYGYIMLDKKGEVAKVVRRTNPNAKWDWYVLGGRWSGFFKPKTGADGQLGRPGTFDNVPKIGWVDSAKIGDIDFEGMRNEAAQEANERYSTVERLLGGKITPLKYSWKEVLDGEMFKALDIDGKRNFYHSQEPMMVLKEAKNRKSLLTEEESSLLTWLDYEEYAVGRDAYVEKARKSAIMTFAVVKDGKWYERGEMGWWGCVGNEKDRNSWEEEYASLLANLPEDTIISVYDCHI